MSFIGDEIKRTRKACGMTSRDVATLVTLTPQYVRLIECGGATPAMDTVLRICNLFPDADSARWAWLLIRDLYGDGIFHLLWDSVVKGDRRAAEDRAPEREGQP